MKIVNKLLVVFSLVMSLAFVSRAADATNACQLTMYATWLPWEGSKAMSAGLQNCALLPWPSVNPVVPGVPARVVTEAVFTSMRRIALLRKSAYRVEGGGA